MKIFQKKMIFLLFLLFVISALSARSLSSQGADKKLDLFKYHNVGNIWLRVSNYGFFGSGDDITPPWPSLEYPWGSAIDYLYQGALWFGAKKIRRNEFGQKLYWLPNAHNKDDVVAWYGNNSGYKTHPVGQKEPNELGIYDMSGNIWEWCNNWYGSYSINSQTNPKGASTGSPRVYRGGGWDYGAKYCRVANRGASSPDNGDCGVGFRHLRSSK